MHLLFLITALLLTACTNKVGWGKSHEVVLANEKAITVIYDPLMGGYKKAQIAATEHCQKHDKDPVPTLTGDQGTLLTQTYECK